MGWSDIVAQPVDRILRWLEGIPTLLQRRKRKKRLLEVFGASRYRWLTLGLLTAQIGLDASKGADLEVTAGLLASLGPPGPGRPDRSPTNRGRARQDQLWGLVGIVGV